MQFATIDDKYEIRGTIGSGGMGVVYEAYQSGIDRTVALKVLSYAPADDPADWMRFEREAIALSRLSHPNVVQFHAYGIWRGVPYIAMERLHGDSLRDKLAEPENRHGIDARFALQIARSICSALQHAHEQGICHRDIKPSNVILIKGDADGQVKLIDFGLAKLTGVDGQQKLTQTGNALGSVMYMSPEQCVGQPVDGRTDIYGLGCLLYHCLTGEAPFVAENGVAVMFQHLNEPISSAPDWHRLAPSVQAVLQKCLAKKAKERYTDAAELDADLRKLLESGVPLVTTFDGTHAASVRRHGARRKSPLMIAAGLAIAGLIVGLANVMQSGKQPEPTAELTAQSVDDTLEEKLKRMTNAKIAHRVGFAADTHGDFNESGPMLAKANELLDADPKKYDVTTACDIKLDYARILRRNRDYGNAHRILLEAVPYSQKLLIERQCRILTELSATARNRGDRKAAIEYSDKNLALFEQLLRENAQHPAKALYSKYTEALGEAANAYEMDAHFNEAEPLRRKAVDYARRQDQGILLLNALCALSATLNNEQKPKEAMAVMDIWQATPDSTTNTVEDMTAERAAGLRWLAQLKRETGDIKGGYKSLQDALALAETLPPLRKTQACADIYKSLAIHYYFNNQIAEGERAEAESIKCFKLCNSAWLDDVQKQFALAKKQALKRVRRVVPATASDASNKS